MVGLGVEGAGQAQAAAVEPGAVMVRTAIPEGRCEVWTATSPELTGQLRAFENLLSPEEHADIDRQRNDRVTATLSRGLLRLLLARYVGLAPSAITVIRTCPVCGRPHGRPRLPAEPHPSAAPIAFSVSHAEDLLVFAFASCPLVGVDVEPLTAPDALSAELVEYALTPPERHHLVQRPTSEQPELFLRYWTGKEAVLKAVGTGLDLPLQAVAMSATQDGGTAAVDLVGSPPQQLYLRRLEVGAAHVGTLATDRAIDDLRVDHLAHASVRGLLQ